MDQEIQRHIDTLYQRTEKVKTESALAAQRIELHERECTQKHERVIQLLDNQNKKLDENQRRVTWWLIGLLATLVVGLTINALFR